MSSRKRNSQPTADASCPIDGHVLRWWFTTDGSGDPDELSASLESVTRGENAGGDVIYRLKFRDAYPFNNAVEFGAAGTPRPGLVVTSVEYRGGFSEDITTPALGQANPTREVDVGIMLFVADEVVAAAAPTTRAVGYITLDYSTVTGTHSQA